MSARSPPIALMSMRRSRRSSQMRRPMCSPRCCASSRPAYDRDWRPPRPDRADGYSAVAEGIRTIGHQETSFCFDNEQPAHRTLVGPVGIARGLVSNGDWLAFMADRGYARPELWLSDG